MKNCSFFTVVLALLASGTICLAQNVPVTVTINPTENLHPISPLIYGINAYVYDAEWKTTADWKVGLDNVAPNINTTSRRLGGNTMTSYNWENGFCNSGVDSKNENNDFQSFITGAGDGPFQPGAALTTFHDHSLQLHSVSLLQLPCAGFVAADENGEVTAAEKAPSSRWKELSFAKPGAPASYTLTPDLNDNTVYVDEELHFLIDKYGTSASPNGIKAYELDNEPGLWHHHADETGAIGTHPLLHTAETTCGDLLTRNIMLAAAIKKQDASAEVFGPAMWGYPEYYSLWSTYDGAFHQPSDWESYNSEPYLTNNTGDAYRYNHMTWVNAYLAKMKQASDVAGQRLLDVFSVHYYALDADNANTRLNAPRSLWDPTYVENSYITVQGNGFTDGRALQLIPKLQQAIADFYPGTKLAITEWDFGGRHDASGLIAQADALGIFGVTNIYAANYFSPLQDFIATAFKMYRNYDGNNSTFGNTSLSVTSDEHLGSSSYASLDDKGQLHLIFINKFFSSYVTLSIAINSPIMWENYICYSAGGNSPLISKLDEGTVTDNKITLVIPRASVTHFVFSKSAAVAQTDKSVNIVMHHDSRATEATITGRCEGQQLLTIQLVDALGRTIRTHNQTVNNTFSLPLDVHDLPAGSYIAHCHLGGFEKNEKLIIVR